MNAYTKLSPYDLAEIVHDMVKWYVDDLEDKLFKYNGDVENCFQHMLEINGATI